MTPPGRQPGAGACCYGVARHFYYEAGTSWHHALLNAAVRLGGIGPMSIPV
ncbi:hypothetical protein [Pseudomonas gregormendelii]